MLSVFSDPDEWDPAWAPIEINSVKESFGEWWARVGADFDNLDPRILEQWVHRHWHETTYNALPLQSLLYDIQRWPTQRILDHIFSAFGNESCAQSDYRRMTHDGGQTCTPFQTSGSWDYPILVLATPNGVDTWSGEHPDVKYLLIEGHTRVRYLKACAELGVQLSEAHELFVLRL